MAIDESARDDLFDALEADGAPHAEFVAWAESFLELNQLNSEVRAEIHFLLGAEEFSE
jgi:hypothetical protein